MLYKRFVVLMVLCFAVSTVSFAQNQLDPKPLDMENDPDIDMFMGCWQNSIPYRRSHKAYPERSRSYNGKPFFPRSHGPVCVDDTDNSER